MSHETIFEASLDYFLSPIGEFLHDMTNDMIQMHGGIGMTDEFDAGFFLKRARACETMYGNQSFHRRRYISNFGI